jgi:HlyD family secretion protein
MKIGLRAIGGLVLSALVISVGFDERGVPVLPAQANAENLGFLQKILARLKGSRLPAGIVKSNGRLEATQVDVSSKYAGRLIDLTVEEGSVVTEGQTLAKISSPEVDAQLRAAQADLQRAKDALAAAEAEIRTKQSALEYAQSEYDRGSKLVSSGTISKQSYDQRKRNFDSATSAVETAKSQRDQAVSAIKSADAQVERLNATIAEMTLVSPRNGRVQYQLARSGEVVAAGAPILTILDLTDVYMTLFLPAGEAGRVGIGSEARLILDPIPQFVVPAKVSFVAADAQFTPKTVETSDERAKLMFRVKLRIDKDVLQKFYTRVKTGVRGVGFVRLNDQVAWPDNLKVKLPGQ